MLSPVLISSFDVEGASVEAFASYTITYGENDVAIITFVIFFAYPFINMFFTTVLYPTL